MFKAEKSLGASQTERMERQRRRLLISLLASNASNIIQLSTAMPISLDWISLLGANAATAATAAVIHLSEPASSKRGWTASRLHLHNNAATSAIWASVTMWTAHNEGGDKPLSAPLLPLLPRSSYRYIAACHWNSIQLILSLIYSYQRQPPPCSNISALQHGGLGRIKKSRFLAQAPTQGQPTAEIISTLSDLFWQLVPRAFNSVVDYEAAAVTCSW